MIRLPPSIEKAFGIVELGDDLLDDILARVKTRCAAVDLSAYKRRPAQARLEVEASEAIWGAFRDHHPSRNVKIRHDWPVVHVTLRGQSARLEMWLGQDFDHDDGIEPFDIHCASFTSGQDFGSVIRKMLSRAPRRMEPEITLRQPAAQTPVRSPARVEPKRPEPARPEPSRRRATLDTTARKSK